MRARLWASVLAVLPTRAINAWYWPPIGLDSALTDNHIPHDIVRPEADFFPYRVLILEDRIALNEEEAKRVREFVERGGKLLALHASHANLEDVLGVRIECEIDPGYQACYIAPGDPRIWQGINATPMCVRGVNASYLARLNGGTALAQLMLPFAPYQKEPIFHSYNPPAERATEYPAIVHNRFGAGEAIYVSAALATEIETVQDHRYHSAAYHKQLVANLVGLLGGRDLLRTDAPSQVEINLARIGRRRLVHITDCLAAMSDRFGPSKKDVPIRRGGQRGGRLEFEAQVRLHSIYEIA